VQPALGASEGVAVTGHGAVEAKEKGVGDEGVADGNLE
jgi:hypothetical protein